MLILLITGKLNTQQQHPQIQLTSIIHTPHPTQHAEESIPQRTLAELQAAGAYVRLHSPEIDDSNLLAASAK